MTNFLPYLCHGSMLGATLPHLFGYCGNFLHLSVEHFFLKLINSIADKIQRRPLLNSCLLSNCFFFPSYKLIIIILFYFLVSVR